MKTTSALVSLSFAISLVSVAANAALIDRGGGLIYDSDQNITWLQDANYAKTSGYDLTGVLNFHDVQNWASSLIFGGYDDWRLPSGNNLNGSSYCYGYNCVESELGHLFYVDLGISAGNGVPRIPDPAFSPFINIQSDVYWSFVETPYVYFGDIFDMRNGKQGGVGMYTPNFYAWAVRPGDVAAVPIPATFWLFGSGLLGLFGFSRRSSNEIKHY